MRLRPGTVSRTAFGPLEHHVDGSQKIEEVDRFRAIPVVAGLQRSVAVFRSGEGADGDGWYAAVPITHLPHVRDQPVSVDPRQSDVGDDQMDGGRIEGGDGRGGG